MLLLPGPVPDIPLASFPRGPALHAFRQDKHLELQMETASWTLSSRAFQVLGLVRMNQGSKWCLT